MTIKETFIVTLTGIMIAGLVFLACGALGVLLARQARAEDYRCSYVRQTYPAWDSWQGIVVTRERWVRRCYRNHVYYLPERAPTRVYGYTRRDDDRDDHRHRGNCLTKHKAIGTERYDRERAKEDAKQQWASIVRFHHGVVYMDLANARDVVFSCSKSSTGERASEKAVGAITGGNSVLQQCEVEARPCRAERQHGDDR
jgi:hypothetical protein